jgi:DNA-binding transcriptional regulator YdaS (Cro superfamily)
MKEALERAITLAGNAHRLARLCEVAPQQIPKWLRSGKTPAHRCIQIERLLKEAITRYELRPDIYPPEDYKRRRNPKIVLIEKDKEDIPL